MITSKKKAIIVLAGLAAAAPLAFGAGATAQRDPAGYFGIYTGWPDAVGGQYTMPGTFGPGSSLRLGVGIPAFYQAFGVDLSGDALFHTAPLGERGELKLGGGLNLGFLNSGNHFTHDSNVFAYPHFLANFSMKFNPRLQGFVEPEIGPLFVSRGYGTTGEVAVKVGLNFLP